MDVRLLAAVSDDWPDGFNVSRFCRQQGISRKTFYKWRKRFAHGGLAALEPRPTVPGSFPRRVGLEVGDEIVRLRKELADFGVDNGPESIRYRLTQGEGAVPSVATIWRVLVRRGLITPQPQKRPHTSWRRFEAANPNELWQIDATDWVLADGQEVEIINIVDDHSRLAVASRAVASTTTQAAWETFDQAGQNWGLPTGCLSDNGLAFSGRLRGVEVVFEANLRRAGIRPITSRPYHPQTCGKVERFQQTLKKWLRARAPFQTLAEVQAALDLFCAYYNHQRPHRGIGRLTPYLRWNGSPRATTNREPLPSPQRKTQVTVNQVGIAEMRRWAIGLGVEYAGFTAQVIVDGTHAAVYIEDKLIRTLQLDPTRRYQARGSKPGGPRRRPHP